ncbi:hypothetical protein BDF14DRAFT_1856820 [Spinellus fusiger]|nr:hypothetical protein BDF14DRAFT_1856820 [Spinellus fusiger]
MPFCALFCFIKCSFFSLLVASPEDSCVAMSTLCLYSCSYICDPCLFGSYAYDLYAYDLYAYGSLMILIFIILICTIVKP